MRRASFIASAIGLSISAVALCFLLVAPRFVESHVRAAVVTLMRHELKQRLGRDIDTSRVPEFVKAAVDNRIKVLRGEIDGPLPEFVGVVLAHLCRYECDPPEQIARSVRRKLGAELSGLERAIERVETWANTRYSALVSDFVRELTIFSGANASLFLLSLLGLWRAPARSPVEVVSILMLVSTSLAATTYFANQNWLLTFVLSDYVGWSYLVWVALLFLLLVDNVFLRGIITRTAVNAVAAALPG